MNAVTQRRSRFVYRRRQQFRRCEKRTKKYEFRVGFGSFAPLFAINFASLKLFNFFSPRSRWIVPKIRVQLALTESHLRLQFINSHGIQNVRAWEWLRCWGIDDDYYYVLHSHSFWKLFGTSEKWEVNWRKLSIECEHALTRTDKIARLAYKIIFCIRVSSAFTSLQI